MIKLLIGGSPCTHWSIAQKNNREVEACGEGWELFKNYLIAKEKFCPDLFLYENNKSIAEGIKTEILKCVGGGVDKYVRLTHINSALVSAQNRQRFYVTNFGNIEQPKDREILLEDVLESGYDLSGKDKSYCLTASYDGACAWNTLERKQRTMVSVPVRVGALNKGGQGDRIYSTKGKSVCLSANGGGRGAKTGLYAVGVAYRCRSKEEGRNIKRCESREKQIYTVKDGYMDIKGKDYKVKLEDGEYIIRKLSPVECERLQTMPDGYTMGISDTQRYKCLGNGWTAEVIRHLLEAGLKGVDRNEKIKVLSMYDGIATGRYVLDIMGFRNVEYYAHEIDKYAMAVAMKNYPDIIQRGDAFMVRQGDYKI